MRIRRTIGLAAVLLSASVLLWSAVGKLEDPYGFINIVRSHELIPATMVEHAAWLLIALEVLVGVAAVWWTLSGCRVRRSLWSLAAMYGFFAVYCMALVFQPPPELTSCGCSGAAGLGTPADWRFLTLQNAACGAALGLVAWLVPTTDRAVSAEPAEPVEPAEPAESDTRAMA